jgi:hypothetical protein
MWCSNPFGDQKRHPATKKIPENLQKKAEECGLIISHDQICVKCLIKLEKYKKNDDEKAESSSQSEVSPCQNQKTSADETTTFNSCNVIK